MTVETWSTESTIDLGGYRYTTHSTHSTYQTVSVILFQKTDLVIADRLSVLVFRIQ